MVVGSRSKTNRADESVGRRMRPIRKSHLTGGDLQNTIAQPLSLRRPNLAGSATLGASLVDHQPRPRVFSRPVLLGTVLSLLRWVTLPLLVLAVLLGFSRVGSHSRTWQEAWLDYERAAAQEPPPVDTPGATPTDTGLLVPTPTATTIVVSPSPSPATSDTPTNPQVNRPGKSGGSNP